MKRSGFLAVFLSLFLMSCYGDNYDHMRGMDHMMNYGYGYGPGGMLGWLLLIIVICVVAYLFIRMKKP